MGVKGTKFFPDKPSGMVLVPSGSFLMGMADDDIAGLQNAPISTVSIKAFFMDETEITNGEYRQYVNWVKDSIVRQSLAVRAIEEIDGCHVVIDGKPAISVSTNNYLGLAQDSRVVAAARDALERFGIGCTGSRFLNGTFDLHKTLEREISTFLNREDTIVMSTGFQANQGTIACLLGRKDVAFSDRENHASIYEGCGVAQGKTVRYQHNDMDHLEYYLKKYSDVEGKIIITDSIFSMSGDIANLPAIVKLARDYNANVMVDEAHGLGVMGENGKGVASYYNLEDEIDIYMGTFSKSLGSIGGFISAKSKITEFVRHKASAFIFTAALPPASVAGVIASLDVMINERSKGLSGQP